MAELPERRGGGESDSIIVATFGRGFKCEVAFDAARPAAVSLK